ncbi:alpha-isopropylmalate synthase regulatory domain-containing protein [Saccharicrinis sp. FJH54]|uniref:alpha-isopropylmalate synthase regulatory domain-containing protein n=1 Tax=Saccharicrinis sp. FJH54 TaxID=3344665 RepID=UPI0035D46CBD
MKQQVEIMDTTLRDGEQTSGVSFSQNEKTTIARILLEEVRVDRLEVASAKVSEGEFNAVKRITGWAANHGFLEAIEVLGFIDGKISVDWIRDAGGKVLNLLAKGSLRHVTQQLRKTPEQHIADIKNTISYANSQGIQVNIYLEDWSNGMLNSPEYVFQIVEGLKDEPIKRFMLPDTLGVLNPDQTFDFCSQMVARYPDLHFDFHGHNDYDLAAANAFSAVKAGVSGLHGTVNGMGERAGNVSLSSLIGVLHDQLKVGTNLDESRITKVSKMVETFSGIRIPANKPLIGEFVFTQCAGIHADGDNKDNLYYNDLLPERFGRTRSYALGKTSGKASIQKNLEELGIDLDIESQKRVTQRIIELGDKKERVTKEDLPYIIADVLESGEHGSNIEVMNYSLSLTYGLKPIANVKIRIYDKVYEDNSAGDGQYDAFMKTVWKIYKRLKKEHPVLMDYSVSIPPGGMTDALVETTILWSYNDREFKTRGLDVDQSEAAIKATIKMLNLIETF